MSLVLYGFLAILLARGLAGTWRWGLFSGVLVVAFIIGISRLYLGAHWLSDVLGGFFIGTSWAALIGIAYLKAPAEKIPHRTLGLMILLVLIVFGGWHVVRYHETDLAFYAPRRKVHDISFATWQTDGWRNLPAWRIDMAGDHEPPLVIQWTGPPDELARFLEDKGWKRPPSVTAKSILVMFASDTPLGELPVLPRIHGGRREKLRLVRTDRETRLVLRLWPSGTVIANDGRSLFIGTGEQQQRRNIAGLITMAAGHGAYDRLMNAMKETLGQGFAVRRVHRMNQETQTGQEQETFAWQGDVLLVWEKGT